MSTRKFIPLLIVICVGMAIDVASAVTFPANTVLTVRITDTISSADIPGKRFRGQLLESVSGRGGYAVAPGLSVVGVVKSQRVDLGDSVLPLTLVLTRFSIEGRIVSMTTYPYEVHNSGIMGRGGNIRFTGGGFVLPPGTILQFRIRRSFTV